MKKMLQNVKEVFHYSLVLFFLMQDPYSLDIGRFFTGYGIGVISYVVINYYYKIKKFKMAR
jgi:hypothetical protein